MSTSSSTTEPKEVFLEADKEIPGQRWVCLSFISPNKVLANKDMYFISEFLKDYEIQYKIKATESFVMGQAAKLQSALSKSQDILENLVVKAPGVTIADLSGALAELKATRAGITAEASTDLEAHVKANMADFSVRAIEEAYQTFMYRNKKKLEEKFFELNEFRTTVQGLKIRGCYDTQGEANARAKTLQKLDPSHNVYVGQVGFWLPWDPEPHEVGDVEYADDQLNTLMKKYKENEATRDELYAAEKVSRVGNKGVPKGISAGSGVPAGGAGESSAIPDMFSGEGDLALRRKAELAAERAPASNTVVTTA
jgi:hypothetical protein